MNTDQLIELLAREATPVSRRLSPAQRVALWAAMALLCVAIGLGHFGVRSDIGTAWRTTDMMLRVFLLASIAWLAVLTAFRLSVPGEDSRAWSRLWPLTILLVLIAVGSAEVFYAAAMGDAGSPVRAWTCARKVAFTGAVPAVLAIVLILRAAPLEPAWAATLGVLAAGAAGALTSELACPIRTPMHILLWHSLPVAVSAGIGLVVGNAMLAWSRRTLNRRRGA
ncbi:MAG: NrsF family protein [Vicinamibacterales bacterium]